MPYDFSEEAKLTNEQLRDELAKLTPLTAEEINKLLPERADKERLKQLIKIVNSSASQNEKLASFTSNFAELGGVVLTLLTKYLKPL
jgi:predicted Zn-ribbon and HTH transcriptional regulator